jgi:exodeoxyribonuclease VII large subunit
MLHNIQKSISLRELLLAVRQELYSAFEGGYWIRAEISEIRENANGHCYLELIEKDASEKLIVAKTKAAIWADTYRMLKP